jgi:hypothetical protein
MQNLLLMYYLKKNVQSNKKVIKIQMQHVSVCLNYVVHTQTQKDKRKVSQYP